MVVQLNHTIVVAHDAEESSQWFAELFGIDAPQRFGHFWQVETANGVSLDFASGGDMEIFAQHYAFLVSEPEFDEIFGRVVERRLDHWADPQRQHPNEINHHWGGRGVYFLLGNDGHFLEIITRPYGSLDDL